MLFNYIDRLRQAPVEVRRRYTLIYSTVVTGIIVLIWLTVLFAGGAARGRSMPEPVSQDSPFASNLFGISDDTTTADSADDEHTAALPNMFKAEGSIGSSAASTQPSPLGSSSNMVADQHMFMEATASEVTSTGDRKGGAVSTTSEADGHSTSSISDILNGQ